MPKLRDLLNGQIGDVPKGSNFSPEKDRGQKPWAEEAFDFLQLVKAWPEIVGERLSQHTVPLKNKYKTMTILTDHSAFSQQLKFMEDVLIQKITEHFPSLRGKVKKLQFIMDTTHFQKQKEVQQNATPRGNQKRENRQKELHPYSPEYRKLKKEADQHFSQVENEEIKKQLTSLYVQLKRQE